MHEQALGRGAALAGAEEAADARGIGGRGEVGVVHHDERPVAAHLEQLCLAGRLARHDQTGLRRAGERDRARAGVDRQLVAHLGARTEHEVEDAGRQVRLGHALGEQSRADGRRGGGRPDDACCRRRAPARAPRRASCRASSTGVISPSTPSGRRSRSTRRPGAALSGIVPWMRLPSSAAMRKNSISSPTSTSASAFSGLPWSRVSTRASSSARRSQASATRCRSAARSKPVRAAQDGKAAFAAAIARRASSRSPSGHGAQRLARGRARRLDGGAARGVAPLAVDEHASAQGADSGSAPSDTAGEVDSNRCDSSTPVLWRCTNQ